MNRIFVDFQNTDGFGRVRLNCIGTLRDLNRQHIYLKQGAKITVYQEGLETIGEVLFSEKEKTWVVKVDWEKVVEQDKQMDRTFDYYQSGKIEGIVEVVEALLIKKGLEVNKKNVSSVLKKLQLGRYIPSIVDTYFFTTSSPKYYLKYTDFLGGEEVASGFIENEIGEVWYLDKTQAEKIANNLSNEFKNVVVVEGVT